MKKVMFFTLLFFVSSSIPMQAAGCKKTPPETVRIAFLQKFPGMTDVDWDQEKNGDWEAEFEQNNQEMSASFHPNGQWVETETDLRIADLPAAVRQALQGKKVREAAHILRADGSTVYEAEVGRKDLLFYANGQSAM